MLTLENFNKLGSGKLPGYLGIVITEIGAAGVKAELVLQEIHMAPNGYLHAGSIVTLADTSCGYGCIANLPPGATGFTTIELKSNHLGTALRGTIASHATALHLGKTTQLWDALITHKDTGKTIAMFRCTQLILYPKGPAPITGTRPCDLGGAGVLGDAGRGLVTASTIATPYRAPVAQLDRVSASEAEGHWFESSRARQLQWGAIRTTIRTVVNTCIPRWPRTTAKCGCATDEYSHR